MTQAEEIFELKEELERVKLLLQKCNSDIVRADRELKSERNKVLDEAIEKIESLRYIVNDHNERSGGRITGYNEAIDILESLKL